MDELLLHQSNKAQLVNFIAKPSHSLILTGHAGSGKKTLASKLAQQLLQKTGNLHEGSHFRVISPLKGSLTIEQVRLLQDFLKLKVPGKNEIKRVVIVIDAHLLTIEAQNALLKLLEEPPADSVIIMTSIGERSLLPTIISRCQNISLQALSYEEAEAFFASRSHQTSAIRQAFALSQGLPGLMSSLLNNETDHELISNIAIIKAWLSMTKFERLCQVGDVVKQKEKLPGLMTAFQIVARGTLSTIKQPAEIKKWHQITQQVYITQQALIRNAQPKLVMTNLFLGI